MLLSETFYRRKVNQAQARMEADELDGLLLLAPSNVVYLSGFWHIESERPLGMYLPAHGDPALFVPLLEQENAAESWVTDIRTYFEYPGEEHPVLWMRRVCGARRVGIDHITQEVFARLTGDVSVSPIVDELRWVKEAEEIALIEQAARYADYCLELVRNHASDIIQSGGTELDILAQCLPATAKKMRAEVGELFHLNGGAVAGTVHSGARAALPHGSPMRKQPQPGEPLIAGIGASVSGYHAESGATFLLGEPTDDQLRCLEAAAACNDAGVAALRPGNTCSSVNEAALNELRAYELGHAIRHRIGHGMGLQGHEAPWLAPGDETLIEAGMVFSNEPGIYRPGLDGYRTINTMIVTEDVAYVPSRFLAENPPEKRILPL